MTLETLKSFCSKDGYLSDRYKWTKEPFQIGELIAATDGHILIAANLLAQQYGKVQVLTSPADIQNITSWLAAEIPNTEYSWEHCVGFLGEPDEIDGYAAHPMMFHGYRVDRDKLRKIMMAGNTPYRFSVTAKHHVSTGHRFNFLFPDFRAMLMGMLHPHKDDPRYEPRAVNAVTA